MTVLLDDPSPLVRQALADAINYKLHKENQRSLASLAQSSEYCEFVDSANSLEVNRVI